MSLNFLKLLPAVRSQACLQCIKKPSYLGVGHGNRQSSTNVSESRVLLPAASYGGRHTVTMIAGDGVGPELMTHVKQVFRYAGAPIDFEDIILNKEQCEEADFEDAVLAIKRNGVALKGNFESKFDDVAYQRSLNVEMRTDLDLFANVVMCRSQPGVRTRHENIDIAIIRENTEGEYSSLEHESVGGVVESLKIITRTRSTRIAKYAFDFAVRHRRKKVTAVHKANIMKLGDGLFLESCRQVAKQYPDIEFEAMIVDNCSMQMVSRPQQFDVMVLPNLYGNIIANIGCGLVGGAGVVSGSNIGHDYAIFETGARNTGSGIANRNIANPTGMLLACCGMLKHLGYRYHANLIRDSVYTVLNEDMVHTPDIGGRATSTEFMTAVVSRIQRQSKMEF